jgi:N utilization substance protein B
MPQRKRSQARMLALQALCLYDALGAYFDTHVDAFLRDTVNQHDLGLRRSLDPEAVSFARALATGAWRAHGRYDELLGSTARAWSVQRMPPIDRNILRLGLHELLEHPATPAQVVINEAIELARHFGDAESPAFVNGVLDTIRRDCGIAIADDRPAPAGGGAPPPQE